MSLDINWSSLDRSIANTIKTILNDRFAEAELPSILRNIEILAFDIGSVPPEITLRDIADPFPEFYEDESECLEEEDDDDGEEDKDEIETEADEEAIQDESGTMPLGTSPEQQRLRRRRSLSMDPVMMETNHPQHHQQRLHRLHEDRGMMMMVDDLDTASQSSGPPPYDMHHTHRATHSASGWEGMNLPFFHSAFAAPNNRIVSASSGLSTPMLNTAGWSSTYQLHQHQQPQPPLPISERARRTSRTSAGRRDDSTTEGQSKQDARNKRPEDVQLEVHILYTGDIVVQLKVDLALNYPSPFFVTLPIDMTISELHIDTIAAVAYIDQKVHVSLLEGLDNPIKDFKIKSRIGEQEKVSLTDVEKVEKFMLKAVQDMVEKELVFPSYYTVVL